MSDTPAQAQPITFENGPPLNYAAWFVPYAVVIGGLLVWALPGFRSRGEVEQLVVMFCYISAACTFMPLPTTGALVWAAAPAPAGLGLDPFLLATVCAVATGIANLHDYYLLTFFYRFRRVQRVRSTRVYQWLARFFRWSPFATLAASSFVPIPVDFVRLMAISERYPRLRFTLANLVGRWPRYLLLAWLTNRFSPGWQWILAILAVTIILGMARGLPRIVRALRRSTTKEE